MANSQTTSSPINSKVSIVVPIYNTAKYLPTCLDSIMKQTHQNLEIILIDDGSTDSSPKIIHEYAQQDPRIIVIHQKNSGQSSARNHGLQKATGKYISFIDSDDYIKPTYISDLLQTFDDDPKTILAVCGIHYKRLKNATAKNVYINSVHTLRKYESRKAYILFLLARDGRMYSVINKLFVTNIAKKCRFDESLNFAEDTKFVLDYLAKSQGAIQFVLKPNYIYNSGTETSTMQTTSINWQNWQTSYRNLKKWLGPKPTLNEKLWLHIVHLRWHISYLRAKRRAKPIKAH